MTMKTKQLSVGIISSMLAGAFLLAPLPTLAKKWTVTERIEKLSKEIDEGRTANELTTRQVETLKTMVTNVTERMDKMKVRNGGKLSVPDTKKLHDDMTNLSVKIYRQRLDNVYSD